MKVFRLIREVLREIFDEAAYERFCAKRGLSLNRNSYAGFLREANGKTAAKVRCC